MKKMSEVFELPVAAVFIQTLEGSVKAGARRADADSCAAHAINHVDALADALELMVDNNWKSAHERRCAQLVAKAALAAYRGEK